MSALRAARELGYVLCISSGRPLCLISRKILDMGVMDYAVTANGAAVVRLLDGQVVSSHPMSQDAAIDCYELLRPLDAAWNAFFGGQAYFEWRGASYMLTGRTGARARALRQGTARGPLGVVAHVSRRGVRFLWRLVSNPRHHQVRSLRPHLNRATHGVEKLGCTILDAGACERAVRLLAEDGRYEVVRMGPSELEITARGVTKGSGARELMRSLGVAPDEATAFGDGGNDLPIARTVGRFVAMGNADPDVKAAATEVCPPVTEDGVAVWIEEHLLRSV